MTPIEQEFADRQSTEQEYAARQIELRLTIANLQILRSQVEKLALQAPAGLSERATYQDANLELGRALECLQEELCDKYDI